MNRWGNILFLLSWIFFAILFGVRFAVGGWLNALYGPLVLGVVCLVAALVLNWKTYLSFFTMKTTKHGLNMGSVIILTLVGLVAVNVLAVRKNKSWDITEDKLNTLSQQSIDVLKPLEKPIAITIFYLGEGARGDLEKIRYSFRKYQDASPNIQVMFYDAFLENRKAQEYLNALPDREAAENKVFVFAEYGGKRERIQIPLDPAGIEAAITSSLVKVTRKSNTRVYFTSGHGEKDIANEGLEGYRGFAESLEKYAAKSESINLTTTEIPKDASVLVVAGPRQAFLDQELNIIRNFLASGGKLIVMADPGQKHNMARLLNMIGVEFSNTWVISNVQIGGNELAVVGVDYDSSNEITKPFVSGKMFTAFPEGSEVRKSPAADSTFQIQEIVKTSPNSTSIAELSQNAKQSELRAYSLVISVTGKVPFADGKPAEKEFSAVVFGDSDFATNRWAAQVPTNWNLLTNAIASLTNEKDLISIRPNEAKATQLNLTSQARMGVVAAGIVFPLAWIIIGSLVWFRRRGA